MEQQFETPSLAAEDLKAMQEQGESVVVLDGRSPKEFRKMAIPGGRFCPNAELGYRLPMLVPDENTPVVINCAGRTRSLIGAQTLLSLGFRNKILALRNGTQGWRLAGFELVHGATPTVLPEPDEAQLAARGAAAAHSTQAARALALACWRPRATRARGSGGGPGRA